MNDWSLKTLGDVCEKITDGAHNSPPSVSSGMPMASVKDLTPFGLDLSNARHISRNDYDFLVKQGCKPFVDDVLIAKDGNSALDTVCVVRHDMDVVLLSSVAILRPDKRQIAPEFLKYYFLTKKNIDYLKSNFISGAAIPRVVLKDFKRAEIHLPPIKHQIEITEILGALDDKIELNRQMNETLEATARLFFKDWFVDFGPTRAKAEGLPPYLAPELWALFPDALDDDDKPVGWREGSLADLARLNPEVWGSKKSPASIEYVDLANTKWGEIEQTQSFTWEEAPSRARRILHPGDTIVGTVRPGNGSFALIGANRLTGSTGFAVLRPKYPEYREVLYIAATLPETIETLSHLADGAAYPAVRPEIVASHPIIVPDKYCLQAFSAQTTALIDLVLANREESHTLSQTRDLLLPKLMSGEIHIREAEKIVEAVA